MRVYATSRTAAPISAHIARCALCCALVAALCFFGEPSHARSTSREDHAWRDADDSGIRLSDTERSRRRDRRDRVRQTDRRNEIRGTERGAPPRSHADGRNDDDERFAVPRYRDERPSLKRPASKKKAAPARSVSGSRAPAPNRGAIVHTVRRGEHLTGIARRYRVPAETIADANGIDTSESLRAGMRLQIPRARRAGASPSRETAVREHRGGQRFLWPMNSVVRVQREQVDGVKSIGIVIVGRPGAPVVSASTGVVEKVGVMRGFGKYVVVRHGERFITVYSQLDDIRVRRGERVPAGREIGSVDVRAGRLHFQINCDGKPCDPLAMLPRRG